MDPKLYKETMEGKVDVLGQYTTNQLEGQLTLNNSTILYVAAQFGHLQCVKKILEKCPSMLLCSDVKGETALHVAARKGYTEIVRELICYAKKLDGDQIGDVESRGGGSAKEMLRAANLEQKDTALHMAARNGHVEVVRILLTSEDPEFTYPANKAEETPLYLAAEGGYSTVVDEILKHCKSPAYGGPGGRTVLHAAALIQNWQFLEIIARLLVWRKDLINKVDSQGSTPLHIAAAAGHVDVMKQILSHIPHCWEMITSKGKNILHIAVDTESTSVVEFILGQPWIGHLINQQDIEGNTPLHLLAEFDPKSKPQVFTRLECHSQVNPLVRNNKNMTHQDIYKKCEIIRKEKREKEEKEKAAKEERKKAEKINNIADTYLIVATLVATVTFAASFTVPGGYNATEGPKQGLPLLMREASFKAFVVTNTIAVICSTTSVFLCVFASLYYSDDEETKRIDRYNASVYLILIAVAAMLVAFIIGFYSALAHDSLVMGIIVCVIGGISFIIFFRELYAQKQIFLELAMIFSRLCKSAESRVEFEVP